jgi:hypothetical protein
MRNATSIFLLGASCFVISLGACGGGGGEGRPDDTTAGTGNNTSGSSSMAGNTSNAGTTSTTAGSTSGGSGGGGAPACSPTAGSKKGDGTNKVIDDIDDANTMFAPAGTGSGTWDFGKDTAAMGTITPANTAALAPSDGGQMGKALHVTGKAVMGWGASLAAFLNGPTGAFDASAYGGVAFYIKGTTSVAEGMNKLLVQARMPDVLPGTPTTGSCCNDTDMDKGNDCYSAHRVTIDVPAEWTEVRIAWSDFKGPAWGLGATLAFNANRVRDINFSFNHDAMLGPVAGTDFDVWIDGVRFLSKDEMGNVTGGGMGGSSAGGTGGSSAGTGGASGGTGGASAGGGAGGTGGT